METGLGLLRLLVEATGLPSESVERELKKLLEQKNLEPSRVTLDDVRELLSAYLQDVLLEAKNSAG